MTEKKKPVEVALSLEAINARSARKVNSPRLYVLNFQIYFFFRRGVSRGWIA